MYIVYITSIVNVKDIELLQGVSHQWLDLAHH